MPPKRQKVKPAEAALPKKIRKSLSLADKRDILDRYDNGQRQIVIANHYNVNEITSWSLTE